MTKEELGKQIETLRKECGVSTYELEQKGIHPSLPATIEKGQKGYSMDSLIKYLNAIDEDIFFSVGKKENTVENTTKPMAYDAFLYAVLEKYVRYVMEAKGTDFITIHDERYMCDIKFTDEEWKILQDISKKVNYPNGI